MIFAGFLSIVVNTMDKVHFLVLILHLSPVLRRRRSAYADTLTRAYTNRPVGHQRRHTKRLIVDESAGAAVREPSFLVDGDVSN